MLAQLKRLGADSLLYAFMNVGTKLIAFIMLPIYTTYLGKEQYGVLNIVDNTVSMLTFLVIFGTDSALAYFYFDTDDKKKRLSYVQNVMLFRISIVVLLFVLVLIGGPWISETLLDGSNNVILLYLSLSILLLDTVNVVTLTVMRFDFKTMKVVIFTVSKMLLIAVFSYVFLVFLSKTPESLLVGRLLGTALIFFAMIGPTWRYLKPKFDKAILKEILSYAAPLVPASIAFWVIASSSTYFLKFFSSTGDVGIYGAATRLGMIISLLTSGVQMAWRPYSMSLKDKKDSPALFAKIYMGLLLMGIVGIMMIATIMPYIIFILGSEFTEAYKYVAFISAASFLNFFYLIISVGLFFTKNTKPISVTFGFVAVANVILNFLLIPTLSIWGAVISYVVSYMSAVYFIFRRSQKEYYVPVSFFKMAFLFINMIIAVAGLITIQEADLNPVYYLIPWGYMLLMALVSRVDKEFRQKQQSID